MDIFTRQDLELLTRERTGMCVSLYLRTQRTGSEARQDSTNFSNMLAPIQQELVAHGMRPQDARSFIRPARALVSDAAFWQSQSEGLAVFLADGLFRPYRLPIAFEDTLVAADCFFPTPLFTLLMDDTEYYLLVLSQSKIRLFRGSRFGLEKAIVPGVPEDVNEAVSQEQNEAFQRRRPRPAGDVGRGGRADENISQYFPRVNEGIRDLLRDKNVPFVLAGVDYLLPLYRRANTYPGLLPAEIRGDLDALRAEALHEKAWPLVEPLFGKRRRVVVQEFETRMGTGQASTATSEIVPASYQGRVSTLLLPARGRHEWGIVDRAQAGTVSRTCGREEPGCEDLHDFAVLHTLLKGGKVFVAETDAVAKGVIAAVFRR